MCKNFGEGLATAAGKQSAAGEDRHGSLQSGRMAQ